ncbi:MAG: hypothetical protein NC124_18220 [Clostridium sp.]|nr:hypothetical protein [Ruminococcus flavefaciens]MCM1500402.1 hypothetical protein [Clostridium sp.]
MKRFIPLIIIICFFGGCNQSDGTEPAKTENKFFFADDASGKIYDANFSFDNAYDLLEEVELQIICVAKEKQGIVYQLKIEGVDAEEDYIKSRLELGFFYVTDDKIYLYRGHEIPKEQDFLLNGIIICQEDSREELREDGMRDYIEYNGQQCYYGSYNTLTDTGFYEMFVWEKEIGLTQYKSGFGAADEEIYITLKR